MKASELIAKAQAAMSAYGDLDIEIETEPIGTKPISKVDLSIWGRPGNFLVIYLDQN